MPASQATPSSHAPAIYTPNGNALDVYTKDWQRLRKQKSRKAGGVEYRTLSNIAMVYAEQYTAQTGEGIVNRLVNSDEDANKLNLVFNLIGRSVRRKMGRLWSIDSTFRATPSTSDPAAFDGAEVATELIRAVNVKVKEKRQHWRRLFWLLVSGVCVEHTPWDMQVANESLPVMDPETSEALFEDQQTRQILTQQGVEQLVRQGAVPERFRVAEQVQLVGEVGSQILSPLNFFIDAACPSIAELSPGQACYIAEIKTHDWIAEQFGRESIDGLPAKKDLSIVQTRITESNATVGNLNLRDLIPAIQGEPEADDPPMCIVLTRYTGSSSQHPNGQRCIFVPGAKILDEVSLLDLKYEGIPLVDFHFSPNATTFWTQDFVTDQVAGQKFLNKRMSQLGEAANSQIYETLLLGGELTKDDIPPDKPGVVPDGLDEKGMPRVVALEHGQLPGWFPESIRLVVEFLDTLGGADLLSQRKFPGQLRGPLGIPMLQELLDSEDGPLYSHLGEQLAEVHQQRLNRVKAFYPPMRTMHYTGANNRDEVLEFNTQAILRSGWDFHITVDPGTLLPELSALREARIRERLESPLAGLYINQRTGRIDISKIADDLRYGDRQRESRESQGRKLARQIIKRLWRGETPDPNIPMSFWPHDAMLDEYEAAMLSTEWLEASQPVKQNFITICQKHQEFLQALHDAQQTVIESKMLQSAVAQATQQSAAKAASMATEAALGQVGAQQENLEQMGPEGESTLDRMANMARNKEQSGAPARDPRTGRSAKVIGMPRRRVPSAA